MIFLLALAADLPTPSDNSLATFSLTLLTVWALAAAVVGFDWLVRSNKP
jgi:hypothetical protein